MLFGHLRVLFGFCVVFFFLPCFPAEKYPRFFQRKNTHVKPVTQYSFIHSLIHSFSTTTTLWEQGLGRVSCDFNIAKANDPFSDLILFDLIICIADYSLLLETVKLPSRKPHFFPGLPPSSWTALFQFLMLALFISLTPKIRVPPSLVLGPLFFLQLWPCWP